MTKIGFIFNFIFRELFVYPRNECDVFKFICTTIRPTKLGFLELYDYKQCAKYVSDYI
jgi:hypothetical protein